jgi:hypothetical protein
MKWWRRGACLFLLAIAAAVFCFGLPILPSVLITPGAFQSSLKVLFGVGSDQGIVSYRPSNWLNLLLLLCLATFPVLPIVMKVPRDASYIKGGNDA